MQKITQEKIFFYIKYDLIFFVFLSAFLISILSISFEVFLNVEPCLFCKLQRYVYIALLVPSFLSITKESCRNIHMTRLMQLCFLIGGLLALYHLLMQWGLISDFCAVPKINSIEQFESLLNKKSCSEISWKVFGMPITFFNLGISLIFFTLLQKSKKMKL